MKRLTLLPLLPVCCLAAGLNVPLTVQEAIFPGSVPGLARTNEPVTVGVPLPDAGGVSSLNSFGLTGASAAQFSIEGTWPDGNIKWLKIRAIVPSLTAGGTATLTLTDGGSGNFGGANLATDNGTTITVATGTATFTVRKANFNVVDSVVVGSTTVVASGTSQGLVVLGPNPTAAYPGNVTCSPTTGGTACTTVYSTANDGTNSTCTIEENGPAMAVLNCQADLNDGAGHVYMHTTAREYFSLGSSKVKVTTILRNADYGPNSSNFATAYKGIQGFELRLKPNLSGTLNYTIGNHTTTPSTGTLNSATPTDYAYLYQAESTLMKNSGWCSGGSWSHCVPYTPLFGYSVVKNGTATLTGTASQYPQGWADISDSNGNGVEIGQYQLAAYGNKSLEFRGGGTDVRVGIWAAENNTTSTSTTTANAPYYIPYPQYSINDVYLNFHSSAPASPANDFLKQQHYLLARAPVSWYNSTNALFYPLVSPTEEDNFYANVVSTASPAVSSYTFQDLGTTNSNFPLNAWRFYAWPAGGASNQMEMRESRILNFLRRGFAGGYLDSANFYKLVAELGFARSDGFSWTTKSSGETNYFNYPSVTLNGTSANFNLGMWNWVEAPQEHAHWYGMPDYYWVSGDETIRDFLTTAAKDQYLNTISTNNLVNQGKITNARAAGTVLMSIARLHNFFASIGDSADANAILARGNTLWSTQVKPDLCASGYPAGCTPDTAGLDTGANQRGTSKTRGVTFQFGELSFNNAGCSGTPPPNVRTFAPFMAGILIQGLWEFRQEEGSGWTDYNAVFDTAYGISQAMFGEMYADDGTSTWKGNGLRYKQAIDYPSACGSDYAVQNPDAYWPAYYLQYQYLGQGTAGWSNRLTRDIQGLYGVCSGACMDEVDQYTIGNLIYLINHGNSVTLNTVPITSFQDNGGGAYTIGWNVPAGATGYRVKWGPKQIVDYIGFNAGTNTFVGNPATTQNWFASTDAPNIPTASGATQSMTISTGVTGLTAANFMVKAYASAGGTVTAAPPSISLTAPASGGTVSGTVTVTATATAGMGIANVQFKLDGANLGGAVTGSGPSYSTSWDTSTATSGSHTLSAVVTDTTGATALSNSISVTVSNTTTLTISNVNASSISTSGATITWSTNVAADSQVAYGTTTAYGGITPLSSALLTSHAVVLSGLSPATTYHYQVMSHNTQGALVTSLDATFVTAGTSNGTGTPVPTGSWTSINAGGYTSAEAMGFEKSAYINSRKISCYLGGYKEYTTSEANNAIVCYSYSENRWGLLQNSGYWASSHYGEAGHTQSAFAYDSDLDTLFYESDGAGASQPANGLFAHFWQHDVTGLSGREKETATMPWMGANPAVSAFAYDSYDQKLLSWNAAKTLSVYDPVQNTWTIPSAGGSIPNPTDLSLNLVYNPDNHKTYLYGGMMGKIYSVQCSTTACSSVTWTLLTTTCTGASCNGTNPPTRTRAAMAYSTKDHIFLMCAGENGASGTGYTDTWTFDATTNTWSQQAPAATYPNAGGNTTPYDKLTYDPDSNVFVLIANPSGYTPAVYAFAYTAALNYGRTSTAYSIPTGSMNRNTSGGNQSWAFDPAVTTQNGSIYTGWVETGVNSDTSACGSGHHPLVQGTAGSGSWTGFGGCTALAPESSGYTDSSKLYLASVAGSLWEVHEESNSPAGYVSSAYAHYWTGTTWTGGQVGCFSGSCVYPASGAVRQFPAALIANGQTPVTAVIEVNANTYTREQYLYVAQYSGGSWKMLGSSFLNINPSGSGTRALSASLATDGTNPAVCWSEEKVDPSSRAAIPTHPQIRCAGWNGSAWTGFGSSALNQSTSNWAYDPSVAYLGGSFYVAWVERTTSGNNLLYVCKWTGTACTLVGSGALNNNTATGWAAHPSLVSDGTSLYVGWEEQASLNQPSLGYVKQWNGTAWTQLGGTLAADPVNGSSEGLALTAANGTPTAVWGELSYGNLRQIYGKQWNGSSWTSINGSITISSTPPPPAPVPPPTTTTPNACDLNGDGVVNATDVQLAVNQALGTAACTNAALQTPGVCNIVGVQRVINASLGGACLTQN